MDLKSAGPSLGFILGIFIFVSGCNQPQQISLWERHCSACHDGKTVLNGKVAADKEQMKSRYKTLKDFSSACADGAACMNIMKHEEKLFMDVGREMGISK
jgi:hypothetical protein